MHIMFLIEYTNSKDEVVETLSCVDKDVPEGRKILHELLDEYLDKNTDWSNINNKFRVGNRCGSRHSDLNHSPINLPAER